MEEEICLISWRWGQGGGEGHISWSDTLGGTDDGNSIWRRRARGEDTYLAYLTFRCGLWFSREYLQELEVQLM